MTAINCIECHGPARPDSNFCSDECENRCIYFCEDCGDPIPSHRGDAAFCSDACDNRPYDDYQESWSEVENENYLFAHDDDPNPWG